MTGAVLLRGVDRAAFAVGLVARLRSEGVVVSPSGSAAFVESLSRLAPRTRSELYWAARLTLVNRADDLAHFDSVFAAVFGDAVLGLDPPNLRSSLKYTVSPAEGHADSGAPEVGGGLPWVTRSAAAAAAVSVRSESDSTITIPEVLPSRLRARAEEPFDSFDDADLRLIGTWLERASVNWPRRRSQRSMRSRHGSRIDLRRTLRASRATEWEPVQLATVRRCERPRRVVFLCDVSRSMRPYATVYLHLMRSAVLNAATLRPEVFVFATSVHRITPVLAHRSAEAALARANATVVDRYGGTHLGASVAEMLTSTHGQAVRGAVVVIASDGWDSDPPEVLEKAMARLARRAHTVVWLNPRVAAAGFAPLAGSMAAALPYCDVFLPANSIEGLREFLVAITGTPSGRTRVGPCVS
ncbi:MAG: VWA domain-containing protein [Mycobacterium sp.]